MSEAYILLAISVMLPALGVLLAVRLRKILSASALGLCFFASGLLLLLPVALTAASGWVTLIYPGTVPEIRAAAALVPFASAMVLYQWALHRALYGARPGAAAFGKYLWLKGKFGLLNSSAMIITLLLLDAALRLFPSFNAASLMVMLALLATGLSASFALYPLLLRAFMKGRSLPEEGLRRELSALADRAGVKVSDIVVIPPGQGLVLNAWVAGILPQHRIIFVTDALLRELTGPEILAVFAHELGHLRQRHLWLNLGYLLGALAVLTLVGTWLGPIATPGMAVVRGALSGLALLYGLTAISRRCEFKADRFACQLTGYPEDVAAALEKLAASRGVRGRRGDVGFLGWLQTHPSYQERIQHIRSY